MKKELFDKNPILKLSSEFYLWVISYCEQFESAKKYIISKKLLKAETSIGTNEMEALNAESKNDFINKMKLLQRNQKNLNTGNGFVNIQIPTLIAENFRINWKK